MRKLPVSRRPRSAHDARGQALTEFALVAAPLFLLFFSVIQFGLLFGAQIGLSNAAREEARLASVVQTKSATEASTNANDVCDDLEGRVGNYIPGYYATNLALSGNPRTRVGYYYYPDPGITPTQYSVRVVVEVYYRLPLIVPLIGTILDGFDGASDQMLLLRAREEMRVEGVTRTTPPTGMSNEASTSWVNC